jgi:hypothetical protein
MLTFFRSFGGLLGVTGSGAILAHQVHAHGIAGVARAGAQGTAAQAATVDVYRHAIASIFGAGTVIVLAGLVALLFLPELPLTGHAPPAPPAE